MGEETAATPWYKRWWGVLLLGVLGALAPQLCSLIPNPIATKVCQSVVNTVVVGVGQLPISGETTREVMPPVETPMKTSIPVGGP